MYIKTDQIDGETDLKPRTVIEPIWDRDLNEIKNFEFIFNTQKTKIDEFEGKVREIPQPAIDQDKNENLSRQMAFGNTSYKFPYLQIDSYFWDYLSYHFKINISRKNCRLYETETHDLVGLLCCQQRDCWCRDRCGQRHQDQTELQTVQENETYHFGHFHQYFHHRLLFCHGPPEYLEYCVFGMEQGLVHQHVQVNVIWSISSGSIIEEFRIHHHWIWWVH